MTRKDAHSKEIGQIWADHLVELVVQEESKRRGGRPHPKLYRSSRREKIDRHAVLGLNWYAKLATEQQQSGCLEHIHAPVGTTSVDPLGVLHVLSSLWGLNFSYLHSHLRTHIRQKSTTPG